MPITYHGICGQASFSGYIGTGQNVPIPITRDIPAGRTLVVVYTHISSNGNGSQVTDSRGNLYWPYNPGAGGNIYGYPVHYTYASRCKLTYPLFTGDTINGALDHYFETGAAVVYELSGAADIGLASGAGAQVTGTSHTQIPPFNLVTTTPLLQFTDPSSQPTTGAFIAGCLSAAVHQGTLALALQGALTLDAHVQLDGGTSAFRDAEAVFFHGLAPSPGPYPVSLSTGVPALWGWGGYMVHATPIAIGAEEPPPDPDPGSGSAGGGGIGSSASGGECAATGGVSTLPGDYEG
jgi:hypothetical protein